MNVTRARAVVWCGSKVRKGNVACPMVRHQFCNRRCWSRANDFSVQRIRKTRLCCVYAEVRKHDGDKFRPSNEIGEDMEQNGKDRKSSRVWKLPESCTSLKKSIDRTIVRAWSKATSRLALITGAYITLAGTLVLLFPRTIFQLLLIQSESSLISETWSISSGWIRLIGLCGSLFGSYYIGASISEAHSDSAVLKPFWISTIGGRIFLFFVLSLLAFKKCLPIQCFGLGLINLIGALSMWRAVRATYTNCKP